MVTSSANHFVFQGSRLANLDDFVSRNGLTFVKVPGDGNCGFVSVALSLGLMDVESGFRETRQHGMYLSEAGWEVVASLRAATADMMYKYMDLIMSVSKIRCLCITKVYSHGKSKCVEFADCRR